MSILDYVYSQPVTWTMDIGRYFIFLGLNLRMARRGNEQVAGLSSSTLKLIVF